MLVGVTLVERAEQLPAILEAAEQTGLVGFDTECNGFYAYHERVCLVQLQIGEQTYLVDLPALPRDASLQPLLTLISNPSIVKVLHGAEFDVLALKRELSVSLRGLFDTMHAAQLLHEQGLSLDKLVLSTFGVRLDKSYQRHDWGRRPLSEKAMRYAASDVRHLLPLYRLLRERLEARGLLARATIAFARVERMRPKVKAFDPTGYRRLRGFGSLDPAGREALRRLFELREEIARRADLAPFRVMNTESLVRLAEERPANRAELASAAGLPAWLLQREAPRLLAALRDGEVASAGHGRLLTEERLVTPLEAQTDKERFPAR